LRWTVALLFVAVLMPAAAQQPEPSSKQGEQKRTEEETRPASSNVPNARYPGIHPDLRVTFQLRAPDARKVEVRPGGAGSGLGNAPYKMVRDEAGIWTVTTPPVVPGFHYYWLVVDGVAVNDPGSETYFGYNKQTSGVEVPEKGVDFYDAKDVPHGEVRARWYHSQVTGQFRRAYVYTPPGYDTQSGTRYPVLYLQHGAGEDERAWSTQGRMNFILDNLIAAGKAKPMIVVMDRGYATPASAAAAPVRRDGRGARPATFEDVVLKDLIPLIDSTYRTHADREHRAMAGLSMGSMQTLQITLRHLDRFAYIGSFSGPGLGAFNAQTSYGGAFRDAAAFNKQVHLLWIGAGTAEPPIHTAARAFHEALGQAGIKNVFVESPGTAHEWQTWRKALYDFAPRLFQETEGRSQGGQSGQPFGTTVVERSA
jgi:enterochelin esterase-like enzyme